MPLIFHNNIDKLTRVGAWKVEEDEQWFLDKLDLSTKERIELNSFKFQPRKLQWLSSRYMLKLLYNEHAFFELDKYQNGKPFIVGEQCDVSISHCPNYSSAMISFDKKVGTDVEHINAKIKRIASRFLNQEEREKIKVENEIEKMVCIWTVKESLFKLNGRTGIEFASQLRTKPFDLTQYGKVETEIVNKEKKYEVIVNYHKLENCYLSYACY